MTTLRHQPVMAEDFGAQPQSPQIACLQGLRSADVVVLVLGEQYGAVQQGSGLSATHEEYRDARGRKPVIAFVQDGISPVVEQATFISEVQGWEGGLFRGNFRYPDDLRDSLIRALHDYELASAAGPLDPAALVAHALALLPAQERNVVRGPHLALSVVGGPVQTLLRPSEIEAASLAEALHQAALFGEHRVFNGGLGVETGIEGTALVLTQKDGGRVQLDEEGAILLRLPLTNASDDRRQSFGLSSIIEETVQARIVAALGYANWLLERFDSTQRLTYVAVATRLEASDHMAWRTQREQDASPTSVTIGFGYDQEKAPVHLNKPRAALRLDRQRLAEDLLVPLRRQWKR